MEYIQTVQIQGGRLYLELGPSYLIAPARVQGSFEGVLPRKLPRLKDLRGFDLKETDTEGRIALIAYLAKGKERKTRLSTLHPIEQPYPLELDSGGGVKVQALEGVLQKIFRHAAPGEKEAFILEPDGHMVYTDYFLAWRAKAFLLPREALKEPLHLDGAAVRLMSEITVPGGTWRLTRARNETVLAYDHPAGYTILAMPQEIPPFPEGLWDPEKDDGSFPAFELGAPEAWEAAEQMHKGAAVILTPSRGILRRPWVYTRSLGYHARLKLPKKLHPAWKKGAGTTFVPREILTALKLTGQGVRVGFRVQNGGILLRFDGPAMQILVGSRDNT